ncbi:MAG: hypothetical protein ACE5IR_10660, partial [bacterium]
LLQWSHFFQAKSWKKLRTLAEKYIFLSEGVLAERVLLGLCAPKTLGETPSGSDFGLFDQASRTPFPKVL